jgi:hypothetical protein
MYGTALHCDALCGESCDSMRRKAPCNTMQCTTIQCTVHATSRCLLSARKHINVHFTRSFSHPCPLLLRLFSLAPAGCHIRRILTYCTLWYGTVGQTTTWNATVVCSAAMLDLTYISGVAAHTLSSSSFYLHCTSQRKQTKARLKRSPQSNRVSASTAAISQVWSQDWLVIILCVFLRSPHLYATRSSPHITLYSSDTPMDAGHWWHH